MEKASEHLKKKVNGNKSQVFQLLEFNIALFNFFLKPECRGLLPMTSQQSVFYNCVLH